MSWKEVEEGPSLVGAELAPASSSGHLFLSELCPSRIVATGVRLMPLLSLWGLTGRNSSLVQEQAVWAMRC